ncbi:hypothetical protein Sjap_011736 [Stephania japonica]|uniref:F-box domain-containing protein n=1 Tax=Stephania japonica TaxID=461633 RepID=A0AAP0JBY9_9MAGN
MIRAEIVNKSDTHYKGSTISDGVLEDIILSEILPRLPVKSLCRFKSVSKDWNNFITHHNHYFALRHHFHNSKNLFNSAYFFYHSECVISCTTDDLHHHFTMSMRFPNKFINRHCSTIGSINGFFFGLCYEPRDVFIYNPITKHVVYVPNPKDFYYIALVVHTSNNPYSGFEIVALEILQDNWLGFQVYFSKTKEWRESNA